MIKYFTQTELANLFSVIKNKRDQAIFRIAYRHGLRASEVGMLRTTDIDWEAGKIRIERLKRSYSGIQLLHPTDLECVKQYLVERECRGDALFVSRHGLPISRSMLHKLMKHYGSMAGLPGDKCHFHTLKHSRATHLLEHGVGIEYVQDHLGHRNIQNTMIYARMTNPKRDADTKKLFARESF